MNTHENIIIVKEIAVAGLYDYFSDMMDLDSIYFKVDISEWKPINEFFELLEIEWIDQVILEDKFTFHI